MNYKILIPLIDSLSNKEITSFRAKNNYASKKQIYISLLDIILASKDKDWESIRVLFHNKCKGASIENASVYLYKQILDMLVNDKLEQDTQYEIIYHASKIKVLNERNLRSTAQEESQNLYNNYGKTDDLIMKYLILRSHLNFISDNNFLSLQEKELVTIQEKGQEILKELRSNHEHFTLYELLKHRILTQPTAIKPSANAHNDLILNELAIISRSSKRSLEAQKLHFLFQSFYFIAINDYKAAIKTFVLLNELFESKITINHQNIFDYYSMLEGILNSLRMVGKLDDMPYFIEKLRALLEYKIPEYFKIMVKKTIAINQLGYYLLAQKNQQSIQYLSEIEKDTINKYVLLDSVKQAELIFYISLAYYQNKDIKKALRFIGKIDDNQYREAASTIFRTIKLYSFILHYELKDMLFLDYEIRSYVRHAKGYEGLSGTEKLLFKTLRTNTFQLKDKKEIGLLLDETRNGQQENKREISPNRYFDFEGWVEGKISQ